MVASVGGGLNQEGNFITTGDISVAEERELVVHNVGKTANPEVLVVEGATDTPVETDTTEAVSCFASEDVGVVAALLSSSFC